MTPEHESASVGVGVMHQITTTYDDERPPPPFLLLLLLLLLPPFFFCDAAAAFSFFSANVARSLCFRAPTCSWLMIPSPAKACHLA